MLNAYLNICTYICMYWYTILSSPPDTPLSWTEFVYVSVTVWYVSVQANRQHVTPEVLEIFLRLTQYLVALPTGSVILKHLFDHILFNPALWIHASVEVWTLSLEFKICSLWLIYNTVISMIRKSWPNYFVLWVIFEEKFLKMMSFKWNS